jgi:hypothetical protein
MQYWSVEVKEETVSTEAMIASPIAIPKTTRSFRFFDFSLVFLIKFLKFIFKMVQYENVPLFFSNWIKRIVRTVLLCYEVVIK